MATLRPNQTDYERDLQRFSPLYNTLYNGASIFSKVIDDDGSQNTYYIGLSVPEGRRVVLSDRIIKVNNGTFRVNVLAGTFTGGSPLLVNPLRSNATPNIQSTINYDVTPDGGAVKVEEAVVITATDQGSKEAPGLFFDDEILKIFEGGSSGILEITRSAGTGAFRIGIQYIGWETDA